MAKAEDALAQLRDIHLPPSISWWPMAPGWYLVLLIALVLILYLACYLHKKNRHAKPKKQALALLEIYKQDYERDKNTQVTSARISELLRRVALVYFPRSQVASIYGEDWIGFLKNTSEGIEFQQLKVLLLELPFKPSEEVNLQPLIKAAESWIKQRRGPCLK